MQGAFLSDLAGMIDLSCSTKQRGLTPAHASRAVLCHAQSIASKVDEEMHNTISYISDPLLQVLLAKRAGIGAPVQGGSTIELLAHAGAPDRSPNPPSVLMLEAAPAGLLEAETRSHGPSETREA